ncbi:pickpocket protein 28 isoform X2 [Halyomorpha halys]|uniref:pickpocket protein 28 isoform X2 n=1 Tax=Halyomorpha halys TaxID=286706 RepID=UPI0006D4F108|nr:pickpocket protein 28-like isoform X2 [Halyomorpha halys]
MKIKGKERALEKKGHLDYIPPGSVKLHFQEYCRISTIHGVRYFGEDNRPLLERISWVFFFLVCMVCNAYLIQQAWQKWTDSPVIVAFAETTTPVWNIPFPAVTICSEVKSRSTVFNFSEALLSNETDELINKQKGDVSLLCDDHVLCDGEEYTDESTIDFLMEVAPPFLDTIFLCKWNNTISENCSDIFTRIFTDEGICYSFNMLDKQDLFRDNVITYSESDNLRVQGWSQDEGYTPEAQLKTYPNRALYSGTAGGVFIVLKANRNDADYYCKGPVQGFKMLLHNPAEFPMISERYLRVPLGQEVIAVVQPSIMTTSKNLRSYSPQQRRCYFPSERYLTFFKIYNQPNCELECLTNYTLSQCGCVALHMPRKGDTKNCGPGKKQCMIKAAHNLRLSRIVSTDKYDITECDCLPACTSTVYNAESSQADYEFLSVVSVYGDNVTEYAEYEASRTSIFFKDVQFTTSRRNELYGIVDFLANCGGLLGLFCGVSILSFVELLYYATLRLWGNLRAFKKAKKKNEEV